jgi:octaheme c-type cytochrome (tetrathionate reductase family)
MSKKKTWLIALLAALMSCSMLLASSQTDSFKIIPEHEEIEGPFADGVDVTDTCLECHEQQANDFMQTTHWTWSSWQQLAGKGRVQTGKRHAVNNFCIGVASNLDKCTECHAGYGWKDDNFDFDDSSHIDCLVCHDTTGEYKRLAGVGGVADLNVDLEIIAKKVGAPQRHNCGTCHFYGGGAHAVKHGDLEKTLIHADSKLDIHMNRDGLNFQCQTCHKTEKHQIPGHTMSASPAGENNVFCEDCHSAPVHDKKVLNHHSQSIACQTCHIPSYAKAEATKMAWDWSAAKKGEKKHYDEKGNLDYLPYKGRFVWQSNVVPEYAWYNGKSGIYTWGEKFDPGKEELYLNWPIGDKDDKQARIYPFKVHKGKQIFDTVHNYLINPHLTGDTGFWENVDWDSAARIGMQARGLDYSGKYGFINTITYWRINHMVEAVDNALICGDCHGPDQTRMDWASLGYKADPLYQAGEARHSINE